MENLRVDSHILKITGTAELPEGLEFEHEYRVLAVGEVRGKDPRSNDNGTVKMYYPLKLKTAEVLKDNGQILKSKDKSKMSPQVRRRIEKYRLDHGIAQGEEEFYRMISGLFMENIDYIIPLLLAEREKEL